MLKGLFKRDPLKQTADQLFTAVSARSRLPVFYKDWALPDTLEGRFECLSLHIILVLRRLEALGPQGKALGQELVDRYFAALDGAVRQIGIGDTSVGKKVKAFAKQFYGRATAYSDGLKPDAPINALSIALARNLLGASSEASPTSDQWALYVWQFENVLAAQSYEALAKADLGALPAAFQ
jgi:cytochrome b pre-mRNA-processing protein 3